ncbi:MAG: hypothetical protein APF84_17640 [Gracilibacter sp. BRH_c7a]|nr:MAG: hypothetical protein APF84_17640 [Gracilibacter sp. BRH_c7a]
MSTKRNNKYNNIWLNIAKILFFLVALYLAYLILRPLLTVLLGISFWIIKFVIFIAVGFLVIHLFLKLIFAIDLIHMIFGRNWRR